MCSKSPNFRPSARQLLKFPIFDRFRVPNKKKTLSNSSSMTFDIKPKKRIQNRQSIPTFSEDCGSEYESEEERPKKLTKVKAFCRNSLNFNTNTRIPNYQQYKK